MGKLFEAVLNAGGYEEEISRREINIRTRVKESAGTGCYYINLIPCVGSLFIDLIRFIQLNNKRAVAEEFNELLTGSL